MNIINKVTIRHLKENKRRSLVTIIGVIISVAMITAVATLGVSFLDLLIRQDIAKNGEWHVQYKDVNAQQIKAIEKDRETKRLILSSDGYATLEESDNVYKPYLYFKNFNKTGLDHHPITLLDGRLPENENEVAISEAIISNAKVDLKIGQQLTVDIGDRVHQMEKKELFQNQTLQRYEEEIYEDIQNTETRTLTIVGMIDRPSWEPSYAPGYSVIGYVDESSTDTVDAYVVLKKVKGSLYEHAKNLSTELGIENVAFNTELLRYYGVTKNAQLRTTLFSLAGIIMVVIIIGSVALIYNAFAISVSERARHLGMLSSVGATKKQKRNSVFFEGAVIGALSIPIGIVSGLVGIGTTFAFINTLIENALGISEKLELVVTPLSIITACGVSILTIFISTFAPARKASKISAIDAIRQTNDIKLSSRKVKTSKLVRKVFGMEAEIGLKNVKRNKKRYLSTVFSLVISIVLFLSVTFFTDNIKKSLEMSQNNLNYDIQIYSNSLEKEDFSVYKNLEHVTESIFMKETSFETLIGIDELPDQLKTRVQEDSSLLQDGKYSYYVELHALDEESFNQYAEEVGVDAKEFYEEDTPKAIVIENITYEDGASGKKIETKSIESEVGNSINLFAFDYEDEAEEPKKELVKSVEIGSLTDKVPMGIHTASLGGLNVIVPEATLDEMKIDQEYTSSYVYLNSSDPIATQTEIEELKDTSINVYNIHQQRQQEEQMLLLMSVFIYGFITLISLISIANIFNTISTSISLRKREFAMLRSVGMTPKGFNKMVHYESIFYGVKALGYGLPISIVVMYGIHRSVDYTFEYGFSLPWMNILFVVIVIFLIVGSAMLYSISKIKNDNIIESLKQENI